MQIQQYGKIQSRKKTADIHKIKYEGVIGAATTQYQATKHDT